jgi:hypothetical protein
MFQIIQKMMGRFALQIGANLLGQNAFHNSHLIIHIKVAWYSKFISRISVTEVTR